MMRSALRSGWLLGSVILVACGGRTLGLPDDDNRDLTPAPGASGRGGSGGGAAGNSGRSAGGAGPGTGGRGAGPSVGGSPGVGGTGAGAAAGRGGGQGKGGKGGKGGGPGKGGSAGKGAGPAFKSCDQCQEVVYPKCKPVYEQCLDDTQCGGLLQCFQDCGDDEKCSTACFQKWQDGVGLYYQVAACFLCGTCEQICDSPADFCSQVTEDGTPPSPGGG